MLENKGFKVIDIGGKPLTRREVEEVLTQNPNTLFIFYNHGSANCLWASKTEKAVDVENVELLAEREVYTVACLSAQKLGVEAYKKDCKAYWGYTAEFAFTSEALDEFMQFANCGLKFRLEGKSWSECLKLAKEFAKVMVEKLTKEGKYISAVFLNSDAEALVCYNAEPPQPKCPLRRIAIRILGPKAGWEISRIDAVALFCFAFGLGIYIHDRLVEASKIGWRIHGIDVGVALLIVAFIFKCSLLAKVIRKI